MKSVIYDAIDWWTHQAGIICYICRFYGYTWPETGFAPANSFSILGVRNAASTSNAFAFNQFAIVSIAISTRLYAVQASNLLLLPLDAVTRYARNLRCRKDRQLTHECDSNLTQIDQNPLN